jgi:hypothetical protein
LPPSFYPHPNPAQTKASLIFLKQSEDQARRLPVALDRTDVGEKFYEPLPQSTDLKHE